MKIRFFGRVTDEGELYIIHEGRFKSELKSLIGKEIEGEIKTKRKHRTLSQNAYYHGVVCGMIQNELKDKWGEIGISKQEVHELLKVECNFKELVNEDTGQFVTIPVSTSVLSTVEFIEYIEKCRQWAVTWLNLDIPEPNEQTNMEL